VAPPAPKTKLKDFFRQLKEDRKVMVAELKMVCAERRQDFNRFNKEVCPPDIVGAIRQCI
jgi:hypothetical protein